MPVTVYRPESDLSHALLDAIERDRDFALPSRISEPLPVPTLSQIFRHSHWADQRRRIHEAMRTLALPYNRLERYALCGSVCQVLRSDEDPEKYRLHANTCHDRWCEPCSHDRSRRIAAHIREHVTNKTIRMLTLTLKQSDQPLVFQLDRIRTSLAKLRQTRMWRNCVTGGCAVLEVKWASATQRWHPHYHLLLEGRYMPHNQIKDHWYRITGDSYIIRIKPCDGPAGAADYVAKYIGKAWTGDVERSPELLAELIPALETRHLCLTFGTWRGLKLAEPLATGTWIFVCSLDELLANAKRRQNDALRILEQLAGKNTPTALLAVDDFQAEPRAPPDPDQMSLLPPPSPHDQTQP